MGTEADQVEQAGNLSPDRKSPRRWQRALTTRATTVAGRAIGVNDQTFCRFGTRESVPFAYLGKEGFPRVISGRISQQGTDIVVEPICKMLSLRQ